MTNEKALHEQFLAKAALAWAGDHDLDDHLSQRQSPILGKVGNNNTCLVYNK